ncbi:hypothetical protein QVD17_35190 [Tagetes erecta]|uniref:Uncharacterized protein n=1 Tax=Tagetes erecta TaxID=13708 RepID=A0AAD8NLQ1_TARER|nr:hypothetical protein QVD17_35190 [Tagetes erecta]
MRCKKHYTDLSSTIGVCACCLRERLSSLIASQQQTQNLAGKHTNSDALLRSLSPHFNSRKSDNHPPHPAAASVQRHCHSFSDQLFYTTQPVNKPSTGDNINNNSGNSKKKRSFVRLLSFPNIFRSRNRKPVDSDLNESRGGNNATSSVSWFTSFISGHRHRRKRTICSTDHESTISSGVVPVRRNQLRDRGLSPVRNPNIEHDSHEDVNEFNELRNSTSGYESTESYSSRKNTPRRTPAGVPPVRRGGSGGHMRNVSGLSFCLSPLVRASPNVHRNQKILPPEFVFSGEIGAPVKPHLSYAKSFCANRSRKLADFGRVNPNR